VYIGQVLLVPTRSAPAGIRLPKPREKLRPPKTLPLAEYSPELVSYLRSRAGRSSAAVYLPATDTLYSFDPDARYLMASTVKVPIMLTQLSRERAGAAASRNRDLMARMIVVGDNDAATEMFRRVGGKRAIEAELEARGLTHTSIAPRAWGLSETTAPDMALLLRSLYYGERLDADLRQVAIGLLGGVVKDQRWGVPAGLGKSGYVAFKGGWLQRDDGWQVHQIGIAEVYRQNVIFAFYTAGQPSEAYGRETLEGAGRILARGAATR
jgi:beta-lactamase class A